MSALHMDDEMLRAELQRGAANCGVAWTGLAAILREAADRLDRYRTVGDELAAAADDAVRNGMVRTCRRDVERADALQSGVQAWRAVRGDAATDVPDRWDASDAPGGYVCGTCGMPTESEPCSEHQPAATARMDAESDRCPRHGVVGEHRTDDGWDCGGAAPAAAPTDGQAAVNDMPDLLARLQESVDRARGRITSGGTPS